MTSRVVHTLPQLNTMALHLKRIHSPYSANSLGQVLGLASLASQFLNVTPLMPRQAELALSYHPSLVFSSTINASFTDLPSSVQYSTNVSYRHLQLYLRSSYTVSRIQVILITQGISWVMLLRLVVIVEVGFPCLAAILQGNLCNIVSSDMFRGSIMMHVVLCVTLGQSQSPSQMFRYHAKFSL